MATIGDLGPAAAPAIPALMSAIWTGDVRRRAVAGASMMRVGEAAVPSLIQSLGHPAAAAAVILRIALTGRTLLLLEQVWI